MSILEFLVGPILDHEGNDPRFEKFANDLVSALEGGLPVFPTSRSWDLGKDGRGFKNQFEIVVASSLQEAVSTKVAEDIERMKPFLRTGTRVYYCTNQQLSDHAKNKIEIDMRNILPDGVGLIALSRTQLLHSISMHPEVFIKHYGSDYEEAKAALVDKADSIESGTEALRLALTVVGAGDSEEIRSELYDNLIVDQLSGEPKSVRQIAVSLSGAIGLGRLLPDELVQSVLERNVAAGLVNFAAPKYFLTASGTEVLKSQRETAAGHLIEGKELFRLALESELGFVLATATFNNIWRDVRSGLTSAFYDRGHEMLELLGSLVSEQAAQGELPTGQDVPIAGKEGEDSTPEFVRKLALRVSSSSPTPALRDDLYTATRDIFVNPSSEVARWLASLCAKFAMLCSLGVEHQSGRALAGALGKIDLVLDTDVAISLLCEGESNHEAAKAIVQRWPKLGGKILVADPVLAEVAHHAWIAEYHADQCKPWIAADRLERTKFIENAFVRAFAELVSLGKLQSGDWSRYIRQFKGESPDDFAKILGVLSGDFHGVERLDGYAESEIGLQRSVFEFLTASGKTTDKIAKDKARRDADLYASMISFLHRQRRRSQDSNCILVSSARRLSQVESKFKKAGETHLGRVNTIAAPRQSKQNG